MIRKILALMIVSPMVMAGDISQCGFIRDSDLQAYCRGTAGNDPSQCGFIRESDLPSGNRGWPIPVRIHPEFGSARPVYGKSQAMTANHLQPPGLDEFKVIRL